MAFARVVLVVLVALIVSAPVGMPSLAYAIIIGSQGTAASPAADTGVERNTTAGPIASTGVTIPVPPNPFWAPAEPGSVWVSFQQANPLLQTGNPGAPNFSVIPNGQIVHFLEDITLAPGTYTGNLVVMADDSTSVLVQEGAATVLTVSEATQAGNTYTICSDFPIGCLTITRGVFPITLHGGVPIHFDFGTAQRNDSSFGLDYAANLSVPEPGTILLLGTGLIGVGVALRRKISRKG